MIQPDRGTEVEHGEPVQPESGPTAADGSAATPWNPAMRIAAVLMLGILGGADIWIFTMSRISSLPGVQVHLGTTKLGQVLFKNPVG